MTRLRTYRRPYCRKLEGKKLVPLRASVVIEKELPIHVNGKHLVTASIAPTLEKEFALGYLLGQGFINSLDEVALVEIHNNTVQVTLKASKKALTSAGKTNYRIVSGGGRSAYFEESGLPEITSKMKIRKQVIFSTMNKLLQNAAVYQETEGVHTAGLFMNRTKPICIVEDIGRHNTLDKIIGYALRNKVNLSRTFLVCTGRMSSEMVTKICRCGIPIVATKAAITDKALEIGKKCGLTLIGFVRDKGTKMNTNMSVRTTQKASMKIYCGAERIACE